nr:MAG TPA: hypothetical protein [Caudoviricetes sp.]
MSLYSFSINFFSRLIYLKCRNPDSPTKLISNLY